MQEDEGGLGDLFLIREHLIDYAGVSLSHWIESTQTYMSNFATNFADTSASGPRNTNWKAWKEDRILELSLPLPTHSALIPLRFLLSCSLPCPISPSLSPSLTASLQPMLSYWCWRLPICQHCAFALHLTLCQIMF